MVGERLGMRGHGEQLVAVDSVCRVHAHDAEGARGEGARLVENDRVDLRECLEIVGALHQDAEAARATDTAKERHRHGDDERARAAHYEEGQAAQDPAGPRAHAQQRRDHGDGDGGEGDDGGVDAGEARDEVLGARLLLAGVLHELEDAAYGRRAEELGGADAQDAGHVDAAGDDLAAHLDVTRHGLAGKGGCVEL